MLGYLLASMATALDRVYQPRSSKLALCGSLDSQYVPLKGLKVQHHVCNEEAQESKYTSTGAHHNHAAALETGAEKVACRQRSAEVANAGCPGHLQHWAAAWHWQKPSCEAWPSLYNHPCSIPVHLQSAVHHKWLCWLGLIAGIAAELPALPSCGLRFIQAECWLIWDSDRLAHSAAVRLRSSTG